MFLALLLIIGLSDGPSVSAGAPDSPTDSVVAQASSDEQVSSDEQAPADQQTTAVAQSPGSDEKKPPTPIHTGLRALFGGVVDDFKNLPSRGSLYILTAGGATALALHPFDSQINAHLESHYALVNNFFTPAKYFGETPEQVAMSLTTYAWGRIFHQPKVSHLGMDLLQAQIVSEVLVDALKISVRRDRPDNSQGNWNFGFPSGHAAQTFAGATVIERHLGWKKALLAYVVAGYVATSRLHENVHYASDVAFGAAIGTMAGRTVTRHGPNAWTVVPVDVPGGGIALVATRTK